jgi:hypothetical protein
MVLVPRRILTQRKVIFLHRIGGLVLTHGLEQTQRNGLVLAMVKRSRRNHLRLRLTILLMKVKVMVLW